MGYMGFGMQRWIYTQRPRQYMQKADAQLVKQQKQQSRYGSQISEVERRRIRKKLDERFAHTKMTTIKKYISGVLFLMVVVMIILILFA